MSILPSVYMHCLHIKKGRNSTHIFLTKTLRSIDSSLIPSCSARGWYTCIKPHPKPHPSATPTRPHLGRLLDHDLADVDHSELLEEVEEGLVEMFTAVLGKMEVSHVHQLQDSMFRVGERGGGGTAYSSYVGG